MRSGGAALVLPGEEARGGRAGGRLPRFRRGTEAGLHTGTRHVAGIGILPQLVGAAEVLLLSRMMAPALCLPAFCGTLCRKTMWLDIL